MKRSIFVSLVMLALATGFIGCSSLMQPRAINAGRNKVALSITVNGIDQPNPAQWATLVAMLEPTLVARGWVLVHDLSLADKILRVDFTPDPAAPDTGGHAMIVGMMQNPRTAIAAMPAFGASPTFAHSYRNPFYNHGYDGFESRYDPVFSGPPAIIVTPSVNIPHCPPEDRPSAGNGGGRNHSHRPTRWTDDFDSSGYREPNNYPSYSSQPEPAYTPPPAPEPTPAPALDFTPSSSAATHPTSG